MLSDYLPLAVRRPWKRNSCYLVKDVATTFGQSCFGDGGPHDGRLCDDPVFHTGFEPSVTHPGLDAELVEFISLKQE